MLTHDISPSSPANNSWNCLSYRKNISEMKTESSSGIYRKNIATIEKLMQSDVSIS